MQTAARPLRAQRPSSATAVLQSCAAPRRSMVARFFGKLATGADAFRASGPVDMARRARAGAGHRTVDLTRGLKKDYSSLPRVMAIDASVLVRVHSMLSRRYRMLTLSPRKMPIRLRQRVAPVVVSSLVTVKTMAAMEPTSV